MSDICAPALNDILNNEIITQKSFSNNLKLVDVTPVFKQEDASLLKNYRPTSVLPVVSKIYERIIQKQILEYIDKHLSPHLYGHRKGRSSRPEVFLGKGVLKICSRFTGGHPCRSAISIKLQSNFLEITLQHGCSPVNLLYIFRTSFYKNTSGRLLLKRVQYINGSNTHA